MMGADLAGAMGLGALTTFHPCPLAGNIAGLMLLGIWLRASPRTSGLLVSFILGRVTLYLALGWLLSAGLLAAAPLAAFFRETFGRLLGPAFILAGMIVSGLLFPNRNLSAAVGEKFIRHRRPGPLNSFLLGLLLAGAFCPASAALFFGVLIPLAVTARTPLLYPLAYGLGSGLPVAVLAFLLSRGVDLAVRNSHRLRAEALFRYISGGLLILVGLYLALSRIFGLF